VSAPSANAQNTAAFLIGETFVGETAVGETALEGGYLYSYPTPERRRLRQMEPIQSMENVASFISFVNENNWSPLTCPLLTLSA